VTNISHISFKKPKKRLDFPLTIRYTLYVDWLRIKVQMSKNTSTDMLRYYRKDGPVFDSYAEACFDTGEDPTVAGYQSYKKWVAYAKTRQPPSDCTCFAKGDGYSH